MIKKEIPWFEGGMAVADNEESAPTPKTTRGRHARSKSAPVPPVLAIEVAPKVQDHPETRPRKVKSGGEDLRHKRIRNPGFVDAVDNAGFNDSNMPAFLVRK